MSTKKIIAIIALISIQISCSNKTKSYNIEEYGAKGDGVTVNTTYIQDAIDTCYKNGGGTVFISDGNYISGTILLKDNVTLHINENAKLIGSSNPLDYKSIDTFVDATGQERGNCLIGSKNAKNIGITGKGTIDGNGTSFLRKNLSLKIKELKLSPEQKKGFGNNRPFLLRFVKSSQITLKDINLRQPAAWTCHFYQSNDITVNNISIYSHAHRNNDGIDLDSSYNATITNCDINTEDDAICFKTTSPLPTYNINVSNCKLKSDWGALKFGTESMGDFYNINVKNCNIYNTKGGGIKMLSVDGANIHDINISNIKMNNVDMPLFIRLGERLRTYRDAPQQSVGSINNITIKNINATTRTTEESRIQPPSGILITGTPNHKIGKINIENIKVELPGGGKTIVDNVEELEKNYPEFIHFKALPAYGLFARHIDDIIINDIEFVLQTEDIRKPVIFDDVTNYTLDETTTTRYKKSISWNWKTKKSFTTK